ncbi:hypothetical protein ACWD8L_33660 [Streptomyces sp. NPDC005133]|uniref:hypothetical protein n=1 Tax=unclassified Streptomyces TaxID=2593676 RepID=UPI0033AB92B5
MSRATSAEAGGENAEAAAPWPRPQRGRTSAIRQLVLQAPAPVIAKVLGYHDKTATRLVTEAGGTWSRYAPGDHTR